jgi:hypothetical protein
MLAGKDGDASDLAVQVDQGGKGEPQTQGIRLCLLRLNYFRLQNDLLPSYPIYFCIAANTFSGKAGR